MKQLIKDAIMENDFLKNLDGGQVREIVDSMYPRDCEKGSFVIREGDAGKRRHVTFPSNEEPAIGVLAKTKTSSKEISVTSLSSCSIIKKKIIRVFFFIKRNVPERSKNSWNFPRS